MPFIDGCVTFLKYVLSFLLLTMTGVYFFFSTQTNLDLRQSIKTRDVKDFVFLKYFPSISKDEKITYWEQPVPVESLFLLPYNGPAKILTSTTTLSNTQHIVIPYTHYYWFFLTLRLNLGKLYYLQDFYLLKNKENVTTLINVGCFYTRTVLSIYTNFFKTYTIPSLSGIYRSFVWVEREVKEFSGLFFVNLLDTRRLLTDYTVDGDFKGDYKTTSYDLLTQNLYYIEVLHWLFIFSYFTVILLVSFLFATNSMLSLILLGETLIMFIFSCMLLLASLFNIYYFVGLAFIFLVLAGLELALNLLIIIV